MLVSQNEALVQSVNALAYWSAVSGHTQSLLRQLVSDPETVDGYLERTRGSLARAYAKVCEGLEGLGIPYRPASAAFFVLCDFRDKLEASTWEAEHALWERLLNETNVNITPGSACRVNEPGWFRLCYAAVPPAALEEAFRRLHELLG